MSWLFQSREVRLHEEVPRVAHSIKGLFIVLLFFFFFFTLNTEALLDILIKVTTVKK